MIGWFFDFLIFLAASIWILKLALEGLLTPNQAVIFLIGIVVLVALSRILKIGAGKLIFRIGVPIASLIIFAFTLGQGDVKQVTGILGSILTLVIVLFGIYIMIIVPFRKKKK